MKLETKKTEFSRILVAIDGSETSMKAAEYAIKLSKAQSKVGKHEETTTTAAKLVGLVVIDFTNLPNSFLATTSGYYGIREVEKKRKEAQQWLDKVRMSAEEQNVKNFETAIIEDISSRVGHAIVDYAERKGIDFIVIGTRGRTGLKKMLLGSVASDVVTYAHCPVMVVRT